MNWLEIIGLITLFFIGVYLINLFIEKVNENTRLVEEENRQRDKTYNEATEKEQELEKWRAENPDAVKKIREQEEKAQKQNKEFRQRRSEIHDRTTELLYELRVRKSDPDIIFEKLKVVDPNKWGFITRPININYPQYEPDDPPWFEANTSHANTTSARTRNIDDILVSYKIPVDALSYLYLSYKSELIDTGYPEKWGDQKEAMARVKLWLTDEEIQFAKSNLHQAVLNKIIVELEMLKEISERNNSVPVYLK